MKKHIILIFFSIILLSSCLSTPDAEYKRANELKARIDKYELKEYSEAEYEQAEKELTEGKQLMDDKKNFKAKKVLTQANKNYETVLNNGLPPYTDRKDKQTKEQKNIADGIKANVAVKKEYDDAQTSYEEAVKFKEEKEYEKAIEKLNEAQTKFNHAYNLSREKKIKAENSIKSTDEAFKEIEKNAEELEKKLKELEKELENEGN